MSDEVIPLRDEVPQTTPHLQNAPFWRRFLAFFIDISWQYVLICIALLFCGHLPGPCGFSRDPVAALLTFFFFTVIKCIESFFIASSGQGLGRRIMNIRLCDQKDLKLIPFKVFMHGWLELFISYTFVFPALRILWDPQKRMWQDRVTGTYVILADPKEVPIEEQPFSPRITMITFSGILLCLVAGSLLILIRLPLIGPYLEFLKVFYHYDISSSSILFFKPSFLWFFAYPGGRACLVFLSAAIIAALILNTVFFWNRKEKQPVAFYWLTGVGTLLLMMISAFSLCLQSVMAPNWLRGNDRSLRLGVEVLVALPENDAKKWREFIEEREQLLLEWENGNPQVKQKAMEKWVRFIDSDIKKDYLVPENFEPFRSSAGVPSTTGAGASAVALRGRDGRAEVVMEVREDKEFIVISSLTLAPWNDFNAHSSLRDRIMMASLKEISLLSRQKGLKGAVAISAGLSDSVLMRDKASDPDAVIVYRDMLLEGLWFPGGMKDGQGR